MKDELALASTEDLIHELCRRHSAVLIVTERPAETDPAESETRVCWDCGLNMALGLAARATMRVKQEIAIRTLTAEEDDDDGQE